MFSVKGELVLDPFLGSGTTKKTEIQNERNSIRYENKLKPITCYYKESKKEH
jgi:DNA modification methylase